jgi:myo-inositol 2-dehydrogenase/D-chiro-inositol 1-dehydrogenase
MLAVGLIGAGRIGRLHAQNLRASDRGRLAAVHDPDADAARALADAAGAEVADSPEALLARPGLDAAMICSPTDTHVDMARLAIGRGLAVFCEKPLDLDLGRASEVLDLLESRPVPFMTGFHRRFDPSTRRLRDHVAAGGIGRPEVLRVMSRDPAPPPLDYIRRSGGIFRDMTIHDLDLCRWLSGAEFTHAFARGFNVVDPAIAAAGDADTAAVTLWDERTGLSAVIQNSRRSNAGFDQRIEVLGSEAGVALENAPVTHARFLRPEGAARDALPDHFPERYAAAYVAQLDAFLGAVAEGRPPETTARDGVAALALADACARSAAEGRPIAVEPTPRGRGP